MKARYGGLAIFVATRRDQVPGACRRYLSVDGAVPGAAVTWDHHQSGEPVNLEAMPGSVDPGAFDGVGTTLADTDALASVVAVLGGGADALPARAREALLAASWWCDHLGPHPRLGREANRRGRRLDAFVSAALAAGPPSEFARLCRLVAARIAEGRALPGRSGTPAGRHARLLEGRVRLVGDVIVADMRGLAEGVHPGAVYRARPAGRVAVFVGDHPRGGVRYTVGRNPSHPRAPDDLRPLLGLLAAAEHAHGPPARLPAPGPESENWGGRREVGGSPWNYGSRLAPAEVTRIVAGWVAGRG